MDLYVAKSGRESGPFTKEQVESLLGSQLLETTDQVWHEGLAGWIPVHQFLNIRPPAPNVPAPPPLHPASGESIKPAARSGDPAPFGRRVIAHLIDSAVCLPVACLLAGILPIPVMALLGDSYSDEVIAPMLAIPLFVLGLVLPTWFYHAWWESSARQATPGKVACGLIVTDMEGERLNFTQARKRALSKSISQLLFYGFLFLTCLWSQKRQCLHDIWSNCLVVVK